jgi:hypothetical protein
MVAVMAVEGAVLGEMLGLASPAVAAALADILARAAEVEITQHVFVVVRGLPALAERAAAADIVHLVRMAWVAVASAYWGLDHLAQAETAALLGRRVLVGLEAAEG